jgi:hypothetical protein
VAELAVAAAVRAAGAGGEVRRSTLPAPGALRVRQRVRLVGAGRVDEKCDVRDSTAALVASAFHLAAVRLPEIP